MGKAFSGTAAYETTFRLDRIEESSAYFLDLGRVEMMPGNGKRQGCGQALEFSLPAEITGYLQEGENSLGWGHQHLVQPLVYDAGLPEAERRGTIEVPTGSPVKGYGLLGPVTIVRTGQPQ